MTGLQEAFYIVSIVYMAVMFIIIIALVSAVFIIKNKINHMQRTIEARLNMVTTLAEKGGELAGLAVNKVARGARSAARKAKR